LCAFIATPDWEAAEAWLQRTPGLDDQFVLALLAWAHHAGNRQAQGRPHAVRSCRARRPRRWLARVAPDRAQSRLHEQTRAYIALPDEAAAAACLQKRSDLDANFVPTLLEQLGWFGLRPLYRVLRTWPPGCPRALGWRATADRAAEASTASCSQAGLPTAQPAQSWAVRPFNGCAHFQGWGSSPPHSVRKGVVSCFQVPTIRRSYPPHPGRAHHTWLCGECSSNHRRSYPGATSGTPCSRLCQPPASPRP
jgi:hypothetical protein